MSPEPASFQLKPGDRVGNYVIREQIGEGGFAIVYAAEQEKPVRRKVALKIIKLGMDTKQVIARFEAERQALALMDHQHIARVLDAGSTESTDSPEEAQMKDKLPSTPSGLDVESFWYHTLNKPAGPEIA